MEKEVEKLRTEVMILKERISILEGKEHRRGIMKSIKGLFHIILMLGGALLIWKGYDYVTNEVPNYLEEKVNELNPFTDVNDGMQ